LDYGLLKLLHSSPDLAPKSVAGALAEYEVDNPFSHCVDLLCRAGGHHAPHEIAVMIESVQLFWPKCAGRVVLILDRGDEEFAHEHIPDWIEVMYSAFPAGFPGRLGNQHFNMYSEQAATSEYIATIDSDVGLITYVTPDLVFNLNERDEAGRVPPIAVTDTDFQAGYWSKGDFWMFKGDSDDWNFMIALPIIFPRAMFPQYRAGVEAIHDNEFETTDLWEHYRVTKGDEWRWGAMSQFCLLGNWMVRHWKDGPIDLRKETDIPTIHYGAHLPYHPGMDWRPHGKKDPATFMTAGRRKVAEGVCELFCTTSENDPAVTKPLLGPNATKARLEGCSKLCTYPISQPRTDYFRYSKRENGTPEQREQVVDEHFRPLVNALGSLAQTNKYPLVKVTQDIL